MREGMMMGLVRILSRGAILCLFACCFCSRDVRLADRKLRDPKVREVTHFGVKLDQQATPEQVSYVLLRAVHEDIRAKDDATREAALDIQFDLCAANEIARRNRLRATRQEFLFNVVHWWTPTIAHYADSFPRNWEEARARLVRGDFRATADPSARTAEVLLEVDDPSGHANAKAVIAVWLAQDSGFWRISHVGFLQGRRTIETKTAAVDLRP